MTKEEILEFADRLEKFAEEKKEDNTVNYLVMKEVVGLRKLVHRIKDRL